MATILSFVRAHDRGFDEETTRIMGEAFDAACTLFSNPSQSDREAIADRIIDAATEGERDTIRLREAGIDGGPKSAIVLGRPHSAASFKHSDKSAPAFPPVDQQ